MNSSIEVMSEAQVAQVSGGHSAGTGIGLLFLLELPHIFMGLREFTNYMVDRWEHGCEEVEADDHFTHFFCAANR